MTQLTLPTPLVDYQWLAAHLHDPNLVILDASWYMPAAQRSGKQEWQEQRIPGARFFDFDSKVKDESSPLPHMLPPAEQFSRQVSLLGVSNQSRIVIYDGSGIFAAPRAWWMFKAMGHKQVAVLDGGLPSWVAQGLPVTSGEAETVTQGHFEAKLQTTWVADTKHVQAALSQPKTSRILDARSIERFSGQAPDPRPGVRPGHMPGAACLPFAELLQQGHFLPKAQLADKLTKLLSPEQHLICSCGSGVTAAILALAADIIGHQHIAVYDGSWVEWGGSTQLPVVTE
ncbi:3-mercaptopyruvate sulfurtransferase [Oceanisphaera pacifica]|uniref:3-mercaptopyruvate sulfurtransferase n=1 Tax=Oceanisphaera pacifica TaxID=2818389 RepID=A0ABS3NG95_9GAMM|nr:3-mercaptopyruvate sulfurtransferase [Oceanisphaera pacifica]MBO1519608.1 3-mercaptopyruvate sulfurtransferase [Oceanisphaera pacifica]